MVKKTEKEPVVIEDAYALLSSKYKGSIHRAGEISPTKRISTGIAGIDILTGGGWPLGRIIELAGSESVGKSAIMLACCEQEIKLGHVPLYQDMERTVTAEHLESSGIASLLSTVSGSNLLISKPTTGEQALDMGLEAILSPSRTRLVVFDSLPNMTPEKVADKLEGDTTYSPPAMATATMFTVLKSKILTGVETNNGVFVFINQVRDNVNSPYGGTHTPGGHAYHHLCSIEIRITHKVADKEKPGNILSHLITVKNKTYTAGLSTTIPIKNGVVQLGRSLLIEGAKLGLIVKSGSFYKLEEEFAKAGGFSTDNFGQGEEKGGLALEKNEALYKSLYKTVLQKAGFNLSLIEGI